MEKEQLTALVKKSQSGDQGALERLLQYAHTSVSYQCRKMLGNEQDAEDMTQEVLLTIYTKLDTLQEPAAFRKWANQIAATRCINALNRSHVEYQFAEDEEGHSVLDNLEELDEQVIPDKAIDNAETARMIEEIVAGLPDAQRAVTLMFYYDEMSVREIAMAMNVSENTVKSRLNYARKAIKEKVLDYEKQGIKLYGLSPLPFLLYFLRRSASGSADAAAAKAAAKATLAALGTGNAGSAGAAGAASSAAGSAAAAGSAGTAAPGILSSLGVKIAAGVLAAAVALGGIGAAVTAMTGRESPEPEATGASSTATERTEEATEPVAQTEPEEVFQPVADAMFPELLQGGLTREQLCGVLLIAPKDFSGGTFTDEEFASRMLMPIVKYAEELGITTWITEDWASAVYVEDANRVLSVLTDYRITAENQPAYVQGDHLAVYTAGGNNGGVAITSANYTSRKMIIEFHYFRDSPSPADPDVESEHVAVLEPNENGLFQITQIFTLSGDSESEAAQPAVSDWDTQYRKLLSTAGEQIYQDPNSDFQISVRPEVAYRLCDLNGNGSPELVLTALPTTEEAGYGVQSMRNSWLGIYTCDNGEPELLHESVVYMAGYLWRESTRSLIVTSTDTFNGMTTCYALSWNGGAVTTEKLCEAMIILPEDRDAFNAEWGFTTLEACEAADTSLLSSYTQP